MRNLAVRALAAGAAICCSSLAFADGIDFSQFGPTPNLINNNTVNGVTEAGVAFTMTGVGYGFSAMETLATTPGSWCGDSTPPSQIGWCTTRFSAGQTVIWDGYYTDNPPPVLSTAGPVTIEFAQPISSITDIGAQPNFPSFVVDQTTYLITYVFTLTAYDAVGDALGSKSISITNPVFATPESLGSLLGLSYYASAADPISKITLETTITHPIWAPPFNPDDYGFAVGFAHAIPEASTWAMMALGFLGFGAVTAIRSRRGKADTTAVA